MWWSLTVTVVALVSAACSSAAVAVSSTPQVPSTPPAPQLLPQSLASSSPKTQARRLQSWPRNMIRRQYIQSVNAGASTNLPMYGLLTTPKSNELQWYNALAAGSPQPRTASASASAYVHVHPHELQHYSSTQPLMNPSPYPTRRSVVFGSSTPITASTTPTADSPNTPKQLVDILSGISSGIQNLSSRGWSTLDDRLDVLSAVYVGMADVDGGCDGDGGKPVDAAP